MSYHGLGFAKQASGAAQTAAEIALWGPVFGPALAMKRAQAEKEKQRVKNAKATERRKNAERQKNAKRSARRSPAKKSLPLSVLKAPLATRGQPQAPGGQYQDPLPPPPGGDAFTADDGNKKLRIGLILGGVGILGVGAFLAMRKKKR